MTYTNYKKRPGTHAVFNYGKKKFYNKWVVVRQSDNRVMYTGDIWGAMKYNY